MTNLCGCKLKIPKKNTKYKTVKCGFLFFAGSICRTVPPSPMRIFCLFTDWIPTPPTYNSYFHSLKNKSRLTTVGGGNCGVETTGMEVTSTPQNKKSFMHTRISALLQLKVV